MKTQKAIVIIAAVLLAGFIAAWAESPTEYVPKALSKPSATAAPSTQPANVDTSGTTTINANPVSVPAPAAVTPGVPQGFSAQGTQSPLAPASTNATNSASSRPSPWDQPTTPAIGASTKPSAWDQPTNTFLRSAAPPAANTPNPWAAPTGVGNWGTTTPAASQPKYEWK